MNNGIDDEMELTDGKGIESGYWDKELIEGRR